MATSGVTTCSIMNKGQLSNILRELRLSRAVDLIRFYYERFKNRKSNQEFKKLNPDVCLPPDYLIYESFRIDYKKYYSGSFETAQWLSNHIGRHIELKNRNVLDWGCGPGRIIRHLPAVVGNGCSYFGTDYNSRSIEWCKNNLSGIDFNLNTLKAELPYSDQFFDVIYGISIFTHLSEQLHYDWYNELYRILKPGGIMFLTTQGNNFRIKLTDAEQSRFSRGELIVRGKVKEGHRTFSAFHPVGFMRKLVAGAEILEHIESETGQGKWLPQDIWIIRKPHKSIEG